MRDETKTNLAGLFLLRLALGAMYLSHAWLKLAVFTPEGLAGWLAQQGLPPLLAWPLIVGETAGGLAILLGVATRPVAAALLPVLLGAIAVHAGNGWVFTAAGGGWEYPAFLAVASATVVLCGGGALEVWPTGVLPGVGGSASPLGRGTLPETASH